MKRILPLLLLVWVSATVAEETVSVYQLSGEIQCIEGTGVPPEKAADLLRGQGVRVIAVDRRKLPQELTDSCGAPAGEANVMKVAPADWSAFLAKNPDAGGYGLWVFDQDTVEVYKYDGTLQCGMGYEIALKEMAKELKAAGIEVVTSRKGTDGLAHISVCGASTGAINVYLVDRRSLPAAQRLGYRLLVTQEMIELIKPKISTWRQIGMAVRSLPLVSDKQSSPGPIPLLW